MLLLSETGHDLCRRVWLSRDYRLTVARGNVLFFKQTSASFKSITFPMEVIIPIVPTQKFAIVIVKFTRTVSTDHGTGYWLILVIFHDYEFFLLTNKNENQLS